MTEQERAIEVLVAVWSDSTSSTLRALAILGAVLLMALDAGVPVMWLDGWLEAEGERL